MQIGPDLGAGKELDGLQVAAIAAWHARCTVSGVETAPFWANVMRHARRKCMRRFFKTAAFVIALAPLAASAVPVTYELTVDSQLGASASWMHSADGCRAGVHNNLMMCSGAEADSFQLGISGGTLTGHYLDGKFSDIKGELQLTKNDMFNGISITNGRLGKGLWFLEYTLLSSAGNLSGKFYFEDLGAGVGMSNDFAMDKLSLWGQNLDAYEIAKGWDIPSEKKSTPIGIGLQAKAVSVPEPSMLALFALAFAGLSIVSWRRKSAGAQR
jgi:hypothetical protein